MLETQADNEDAIRRYMSHIFGYLQKNDYLYNVIKGQNKSRRVKSISINTLVYLVSDMLNCSIFKSPKFGEIRVTKDCYGKPLFVAKDVAFVMFGCRGQKILPELCKHLVQIPHPQYRNRKVFAIGLSDVSRLIAKSSKSYKIDFHDWIYDIVVPQITQNRIYTEDGQEQETNTTGLCRNDKLSEIIKELSTESRYFEVLAFIANVEEAVIEAKSYLMESQANDLFSAIQDYKCLVDEIAKCGKPMIPSGLRLYK